MSDEPPDDAGGGYQGSSPSFLGCLLGAVGLIFTLTGGICVWNGFSGLSVEVLLIGILMMVGSWLMTKRRGE